MLSISWIGNVAVIWLVNFLVQGTGLGTAVMSTSVEQMYSASNLVCHFLYLTI
jgi:hypothetical protein